ncbi:MAG: DivIVA domain-containing protein [Candidatus Caldarchaeum sp.]
MSFYNFTPLEIEGKEFRLTFRGYCREEVQNFLRALASEWEVLIRENRALKEKLSTLEAECRRLHELENLLKDSLIIAQSAAEEAKASARKEAQAILQEAEAQRARLLAQIEYLQAERSAFVAQLRSLLEAFYEKLASINAPTDLINRAVAPFSNATTPQNEIKTESA